MWHTWKTTDVHTRFWIGDLRERDHLKDVGVDGETILKWNLKNYNGGAWTGFIRVRIGTGGWHL
jgi:hypothetical protein